MFDWTAIGLAIYRLPCRLERKVGVGYRSRVRSLALLEDTLCFGLRNGQQLAVQSSKLGQVAAHLDPDRLVDSTHLGRIKAGGCTQPRKRLASACIIGGVQQHGP